MPIPFSQNLSTKGKVGHTDRVRVQKFCQETEFNKSLNPKLTRDK